MISKDKNDTNSSNVCEQKMSCKCDSCSCARLWLGMILRIIIVVALVFGAFKLGFFYGIVMSDSGNEMHYPMMKYHMYR